MFAFLGGGIVTFIGSIIKFFNAGDVLNFYDEKIHDKNKVSKIVGNDISTLLSNTAYLKIIIKKSILRNIKKIYDLRDIYKMFSINPLL